MTETLDQPRQRVWFISWQWRIVLPLFVLVLLVAMVGAYLVAASFGRSFGASLDNILRESVRGMNNRSTLLYQRHLQETQRVAFTIGVPEAVQRGEVEVLQANLEALARAGDLDSVILTDVSGVEVFGVQRVLIPDVDDYAVNTGTDLSDQALVRSALGGRGGESALFRTPEGTLLYVSSPLQVDGEVVGTVLAGRHLDTVAQELSGTAAGPVAVYGVEGELVETTLDLTDDLRAALRLPSDVFETALAAPAAFPVRSVTLTGNPYRVAYVPLSYGGNVLGVVAVFLPDNLPFVNQVGRQLVALMATALTGAAVTAAFLGVGVLTGRIRRVEQTAAALARGEAEARTQMQPSDEVGAMGAALDAYADRVQQEQDALQRVVRRQRRETNHLVAVIQAMPDGVIVQDQTGKVTFINEVAKALLGGGAVTQPPDVLQVMTERVAGTLGTSVAPGVYALGDPQQVSVGERMLHAQAAAVQAMDGKRVGTVIALRDISDYVRQEQERERLLQQVEDRIQQPLHELAQTGAFGAPPIHEFARQITDRAVALRKLVVQMRDLTAPEVAQQEGASAVIRLDTLVWSVANEWRQIAQAADLKLHVSIDAEGLHVIGDEKRLRWAIGNMLDNAIKYTPPGGTVTLEINGESNGQATMRVRDNGVGIAPEELKHVTTRFYRGNPTMKDGEIIRTPGMGHGLYVAHSIFEAHGGFLKVKSRPGTGTAVYFSLPVTAAETMDMPRLRGEFEGETVQLPEDYLSGLE